ncbi:amidohydrolase 1 [Coleophoma cylindrospora]|uniref:Amidohydrolase 1 n=1 Tax=Coleophoma cylindrospora TaxID=1849047 RepID=A0A3D8SFY9_9HELO|nr:amidohydrolase 1 [Coleophoma cylindrospora]
MEKHSPERLPRYSPIDELAAAGRPHYRVRRSRILKAVGLGCLVFVAYTQWAHLKLESSRNVSILSPARLQADLETCKVLQHKPKDPSGPRERNARYIDGHKPTLIRNATIWTGEPVAGTTAADARLGKGYGWIKSDVLLEYGLITQVGPEISPSLLPEDCQIWDAEGRQLTAGIVDMHSHTGVYPVPTLNGGSDGNELSADITPYVRSIDGLDPLDHQLQVIKSGGVTTSLILPGSGNNMGGEAFIIKHAVGKDDGRAEIGPKDMLADPEQNWRYMKMACGENPKRIYGDIGRGPFSRMGESWYFRHAFEEARAMVTAQDDWCAAASNIGAENMKEYLPQDLKWESLGAALRGQVHINTHCYTIADLEAFIDHTNEFKFPVRAFHHAHQTFLVPEILKRAWGGRAPAAAIFADNMYYKVEAYIGSEQAGKILYDNDITPVYVSDNPVLNAQHVVFEAAKGYRYGLPYHAALASVTTAPAELLGMGERIGKVKNGFDADIVVWDSDPLSVGATPVQVWIDGTAQYPDPVVLEKQFSEPISPNEDLQAEIKEEPTTKTNVVFTGVSKIMIPGFEHILEGSDKPANVIVEAGKIVCAGPCAAEISTALSAKVEVISLKSGYLSPAYTAFGSDIGMSEITSESATQNGHEGSDVFSRAIDGLLLTGKQLKASYAHGVTRAVSAPAHLGGGQQGVGVGFSTGASHSLEKGAIWSPEATLHYTLSLAAKEGKTPSLSSAIGSLRTKLLEAVASNDTIADTYSEKAFLKRAVAGDIPLVITVNSADTIAAILRVKSDVENAIKAQDLESSSQKLNVVLLGAAEAHIVADEIAAAHVSVVLAPLLPYAEEWDTRRSLSGAPLTNGTNIDVLLDAGVLTAIGTRDTESWEVRGLSLMAGIAYKNSGGRLSESAALALIGKNFDKILKSKTSNDDFVLHEGSPFDIGSRVKAVGSQGRVSVY